MDAAADVAVGIDPGAGLDVNTLSDKAEWRAAFVGFDECTFRFVIELRSASQFAQRAEFKQQCARLRRVRYWIAHLTRAQIDIHIRKPGRRIEYGEQPIAQIFR